VHVCLGVTSLGKRRKRHVDSDNRLCCCCCCTVTTGRGSLAGLVGPDKGYGELGGGCECDRLVTCYYM